MMTWSCMVMYGHVWSCGFGTTGFKIMLPTKTAMAHQFDMFVYIYIYVYNYIYICISISISILYVCMCIYIYICVCVERESRFESAQFRAIALCVFHGLVLDSPCGMNHPQRPGSWRSLGIRSSRTL